MTETRLGTTPTLAFNAMAEGILSALTMVMETSMTNLMGVTHTAVPEEVRSPWTTTAISTSYTLPHPLHFILVEAEPVDIKLPTTNTAGIHAIFHPRATTTVAPHPFHFILVKAELVRTRLPTINTLGIHAISHPLATTAVAPTPFPSQRPTIEETIMCLHQEARRTPGTATAIPRIGAEALILPNTPAPPPTAIIEGTGMLCHHSPATIPPETLSDRLRAPLVPRRAPSSRTVGGVEGDGGKSGA